MSDTKTPRTLDIPATSLPVFAEADVVVVGGGTSGFMAATAAARTGARALIVEKSGYLGGCTTAPYNTGLGIFFDSDGNQIIRGLAWEFLQRMEADGQALLTGNGGKKRNQIWPVWTRKVALDMVEGAGADFLFHTWTSGVVTDGGTIRGIVVHNKAGSGVILGTCFVDATGDADIAAFAGAPFDMTETEHLQQVSCDYIACGVDHERVKAWARENKDRLDLRIGGLDEPYEDGGPGGMLTITVPNPGPGADHIGVMPTVKLCIYREAVRLQGNADINPLDPKALTRAEANGLRGALGHLKYMRDLIPGFENAFIVAQSHLGVRETRRILGDYVITIDDLHGQARFDDVVALNCRGLDYHLKGTVFKYASLKGNHDVPLRALTPKNVENLLVAGRSVACDHLSQASLRGAATCMATGHAAGVTAALAARQGGKIRGVDIRLAQRTLLAQDAILGTGDRAGMFGG